MAINFHTINRWEMTWPTCIYAWSLYCVCCSTSRVAQKTIKINGVTIPEGVNVQLPIHLIHYNPEIWPEPEKFDPERYCHFSIFSALQLVLSHHFIPSSGLLLRRRQSVLLSATSPLAGALATALEWGLPSWRWRWLSLRYCRNTSLCGHQKRRLVLLSFTLSRYCSYEFQPSFYWVPKWSQLYCQNGARSHDVFILHCQRVCNSQNSKTGRVSCMY